MRKVNAQRKSRCDRRNPGDKVGKHNRHHNKKEVGRPKQNEPQNIFVLRLRCAENVLHPQNVLHHKKEPCAERTEQLHNEHNGSCTVHIFPKSDDFLFEHNFPPKVFIFDISIFFIYMQCFTEKNEKIYSCFVVFQNFL